MKLTQMLLLLELLLLLLLLLLLPLQLVVHVPREDRATAHRALGRLRHLLGLRDMQRCAVSGARHEASARGSNCSCSSSLLVCTMTPPPGSGS